ncbi:hypothetical protein Tco_1098303 [Tanacetum coccineum]
MRLRHPDQLALLANNYNPPPSYSSSRSHYYPSANYQTHQTYQTVQSYQPITPLIQQPIIQSPPQLSYNPLVIQQQKPAQSTQCDSRFVVPSFLPTDDPIASLNNITIICRIQELKLLFKMAELLFRTFKDVYLKVMGLIQERVKLQEREAPTLVKDVEWFKEKMLLAQAQKADVILYEDQQDFCLIDHVDAYDSDCDDEATACAIFMASLSPARSINGDTAGPSFDSELLYEVPHYDTYHKNVILNDVVQEMEYNDHVVFNDNSCDELTNNSNVISYVDYMVTIESDVAQYVPPPEQDKNGMILSVIERMQGQVDQCNTVNQEAKCVNES